MNLLGGSIARETLYSGLFEALKKIDGNLNEFVNDFPKPASVNNIYGKTKNGGDNDDWTSSFWTGMLWLAYDITGDNKFEKLATFHHRGFEDRIKEKIGINHHDLGFLYTLSTVANYKITNWERAKETSIMAADHLIERYKEKGEFIQAWGDLDDPGAYRLIIDCYMNLPLLFWASEVTGDDKYKEVAKKHAMTAGNLVIREDGSTHHTYYFDPETGVPTEGVTAQGYSDTSAWARGQAWGVYGFALAYSYTKDPVYIERFERVTDYFIDKLPKDNVCYWDLVFGDGDTEERDTSAAAIAACGILEMLPYLPENHPKYGRYEEAAGKMMDSLIKNYTTKDLVDSNGLLREAVYYKGGKSGVDECNIWGDYFYMEAIVRLLKPEWKKYW